MAGDVTVSPWISGTFPGGRASLRDGPRLAARQVRGRHRILVIRGTGAPQNGIDPADGSCLRMTVRGKRESPSPRARVGGVDARAQSTEHVRWPGGERTALG